MKRIGQELYNSAAWHKLRLSYMSSRNWICERCGQPATICHHRQHLTAENVDNAGVALNFDNLEALCQHCHNLEHDHFVAQGKPIFNAKAEMIGRTDDRATREFELARAAIESMDLNPPSTVQPKKTQKAQGKIPFNTPKGQNTRGID